MERMGFQELLQQVEKKSYARKGALSELAWIRRSVFLTPPGKVSARTKAPVIVIKEEQEDARLQNGGQNQQSMILARKPKEVIMEEATGCANCAAPTPAVGKLGPDMACTSAGLGAGLGAPQQQNADADACKTEEVLVNVRSGFPRGGNAIDASVNVAGGPEPDIADTAGGVGAPQQEITQHRQNTETETCKTDDILVDVGGGFRNGGNAIDATISSAAGPESYMAGTAADLGAPQEEREQHRQSMETGACETGEVLVDVGSGFPKGGNAIDATVQEAGVAEPDMAGTAAGLGALHQEQHQQRREIKACKTEEVLVEVESCLSKGSNAIDAAVPGAGGPGPEMDGSAASLGAPQEQYRQSAETETCNTEEVLADVRTGLRNSGYAGGPEAAAAGAAVGREATMEDMQDAVISHACLSEPASNGVKVTCTQSTALHDNMWQAAPSGLGSFSNLNQAVQIEAGERAAAFCAPDQFGEPQLKIEREQRLESAEIAGVWLGRISPTPEDGRVNSGTTMFRDEGQTIEQPESTIDLVIRVLGLGTSRPSEVSTDHLPEQAGENTEIVYCACKELETPNTTILCDKCDRSFHLDCANVGSELATTVDEWFCNDCLCTRDNWKWRLRRILRRPKDGERSAEPEAEAEAGKSETEACTDSEDQPVATKSRPMKLQTRRATTSGYQSWLKPLPTSDIATRALEGLRAYISEKNGTLEEGWTVEIVPRQHSHGRMHINYWSPENMVFKTKLKVAEFLGLSTLPNDAGWIRSEHDGVLGRNSGIADHQQPSYTTDQSAKDYYIPGMATLGEFLDDAKGAVSGQEVYSGADHRVPPIGGIQQSEKRSRDEGAHSIKKRRVVDGTEESGEWNPEEMEESEEWSVHANSKTRRRPGFSKEEIRMFVARAHQKLLHYVAARGGVLEKGWTTHCMQVKQQRSLQAFYKSPNGKRYQSRVQIGNLLNLPAEAVRPQIGAETAFEDLGAYTTDRVGVCGNVKPGTRPKLVPRPKLGPRSKLPTEPSGLSNGGSDGDPWSIMKSLIVPGKNEFQGSEDEDGAEDVVVAMPDVPTMPAGPAVSSMPPVPPVPCLHSVAAIPTMPAMTTLPARVTVPSMPATPSIRNGPQMPTATRADVKKAVSIGIQTDERWIYDASTPAGAFLNEDRGNTRAMLEPDKRHGTLTEVYRPMKRFKVLALEQKN